LADSLVTDPHKGLFIPYGTGAVLIKNKEAALQSHQYTANYLQDSAQFSPDILNPADISPELTRHFRALRIWLPLQLHGIKPFVACLEEKLLLIKYFRSRILELGFKTGPEPDLSISYFWYPSETVEQNEYNRKLLEVIHKEGRIFFSSTIIDNKFVIRIAILSFRTKLKTIDLAIEVLNNARLKLLNDFDYS
jgi:glutamate/tyrosine decarboxylase-like PLP-dependent enzyme